MSSRSNPADVSQDRDEQSLVTRIRSHYNDLPESERKIADLFLEYPWEVAAYSATELAQWAGSSKAAVSRFIRRIGLSGFEEVRRVARESQNWGSPLSLMPRSMESEDRIEHLRQHVDQDVRIISKTFESIDLREIDRIVEALLTARRVLILGYRNSYFLAGYLRMQMLQAREQVFLLPEAGETLAEFLVDVVADDLLVVIGFRRRVPETILALHAAIEAGSKTLYITDSSAGRVDGVGWMLNCPVRGEGPFDRYTGAMSLLHYLGEMLMNTAGDRGRKRLRDMEILHDRLHEL
jgi:DNA-binding MurR/RpiR family transcriptional regulator